MLPRFPSAVPELPVTNIQQAAQYYVTALGFRLDWHSEPDGIAGISQGDGRLFLADAAFRHPHGNNAPVVIWLNLESKQQVDELYHRWHQAGARTVAEPENKPWHLREFTAVDFDDNQLRVFYDFSSEPQPSPDRPQTR